MDDIKYATVSSTGHVTPHTNLDDAINDFYRGLWGIFLMNVPSMRNGEAQIRDNVEKLGFHGAWEPRYESSTQSAAIGKVDQFRSLDFYINKHIPEGSLTRKALDQSIEGWNSRTGPRVGDYVTIGDRTTRITHDWGNGFQDGGGGGSYNISRNGYASYSGSLDSTKPKDFLVEREGDFYATFWVWLDGVAGASRAIYVQLPVRHYDFVKTEEAV